MTMIVLLELHQNLRFRELNNYEDCPKRTISYLNFLKKFWGTPPGHPSGNPFGVHRTL